MRPTPEQLRPFSKINLSLEVGPRRADGFHDVHTLLQSIALSDVLTITSRPGAFALTVDGPGIPAGPENLVWRAARVLWLASGRAGEPQDVHVALEKHVPAGAGLGGGSADAAAALVGLNRTWNAGLSLSALAELAAALGADVSFFLLGGLARGTGKGERLASLDDLSPLDVVIISPRFTVSTADAYGWLAEYRDSGGPLAVAAEIELSGFASPLSLRNDLQRPVALRHPEIDQMIAACRAAGALGSAMSGSGSAVFGLFPAGEGGAAVARITGPGWVVRLTRTLTRQEAAGQIGL